MTKEDLNQMCREYQQVLSMSEEKVFAMYEESKVECIASFETEIEYWENYYYGEKDEEEYNEVDPAFYSCVEVNSMFV